MGYYHLRSDSLWLTRKLPSYLYVDGVHESVLLKNIQIRREEREFFLLPVCIVFC